MGGGFRLDALIEVTGDPSTGSADGVIAALGDWSNGWTLVVIDGVPQMAFSIFGELVIAQGPALSAGSSAVSVIYERNRSARLVRVEVRTASDQVVSGDPVELLVDLPFRWQIGGGGLLIGRDAGFPVWERYEPPHAFPGEIESVTITSTMLAAMMGGTRSDEIRSFIHRE